MKPEHLELMVVCMHVLLAGSVASHALLHKQDPRSAWAWILVCMLVPLGGALLYLGFGINRITRRARRTIGGPSKGRDPQGPDAIPQVDGIAPSEVAELVRMGRAVARRELLAGNRVDMLCNGEQAYPAMLAAIGQARHSVWLTTYIFDRGHAGESFAQALRRAMDRGVQVRVMLDGFGDWRFPARGSSLLRRHGVPVALFLPPHIFPPQLHVNLRNHRKLLCIDGTLVFTGGMNIGDHHLDPTSLVPGTELWRWKRDFAADLHFRVEGPVALQCADVFAKDWLIIHGEALELPVPEPREPSGAALCRVITDGPNERMGRLQMILLGALATAHRSVRIMTPYFVPTPELSSALTAAALRGVEVSLLLPERSNHWWLDAATRRWLAQLSEVPLQVWRRPSPFAHSKLFLVDDYYAIVGSANLDYRSLRLNFELMLEIYDTGLVAILQRHFAERLALSRPLDLHALKERPATARLWDSLFWLFSRYL